MQNICNKWKALHCFVIEGFVHNWSRQFFFTSPIELEHNPLLPWSFLTESAADLKPIRSADILMTCLKLEGGKNHGSVMQYAQFSKSRLYFDRVPLAAYSDLKTDFHYCANSWVTLIFCVEPWRQKIRVVIYWNIKTLEA